MIPANVLTAVNDQKANAAGSWSQTPPTRRAHARKETWDGYSLKKSEKSRFMKEKCEKDLWKNAIRCTCSMRKSLGS